MTVAATGPGAGPRLPTWREAWTRALYADDGFYRRESPAAHFRTSAHASPLFALAVARLARRHGLACVTDVGAGGGELLQHLDHVAGADLELCGVDLAARPTDLPAHIGWSADLPPRLDGLVIANEYLDNVPCDVVQVAEDGRPRLVHVDPVTGHERLGDVVHEDWLARWWPLRHPGERAEIGSTRDEVWADLVRRLDGGIVVAVDYGHTRDTRPAYGSLSSYQRGRQVDPVPDGTRDVTAHVGVDSLGGHVTTQRAALLDLGIDGTRPDAGLARSDPAGYVRALQQASQAAELTAPGALGDFFWVSTAPVTR